MPEFHNNNSDANQQARQYVSAPCIQGVSERIQRILYTFFFFFVYVFFFPTYFETFQYLSQKFSKQYYKEIIGKCQRQNCNSRKM